MFHPSDDAEWIASSTLQMQIGDAVLQQIYSSLTSLQIRIGNSRRVLDESRETLQMLSRFTASRHETTRGLAKNPPVL